MENREVGYYWCFGHKWSDNPYWQICYWINDSFWRGDEDFSEDSFFEIIEDKIPEPTSKIRVSK